MKRKIKEFISRLNGSYIIKGFLTTILGSGASKIILIFATFICSNLLGKLAFGELSFVRNTLNMILCICALNFSSLCTKLTSEARQTVVAFHRLFLLFIFSIFVCLIIGILLIVLPDEFLLSIFTTQKVVDFFKIVGILLPLFMLQPLIEGILRGLKKFKLIGILQTTSSIFFIVVVYFGIKLYGLTGALIGVTAYYGLYSVASIISLYKVCNIFNYFYKFKGFWKERKALHKMILPLFFMSFIDAPVMWIAQVMLSKSGTMESVGSMTAMMQIRNLAMLIPSYFSNTYLSFASELNSQKKYVEYYRQYQKIIHIYWGVGISMFFIFSLFSKPILSLYGYDFQNDWLAMIISNLGIPLVMLIGLYRIDLLLKEHQQYLLYISVVWNTIWILSLYALNNLGISPLYSFFISQNIGAIVFILSLMVIYYKDKKIYLR